MKHIIQLWSVYWVKHMKKMNEAVGTKNHLKMNGEGEKIVCPFRRQEIWKCIGCVLSEVTYRKK